MTPAVANAWPLGRLFHLHPGASQSADSRVSLRIYNKGESFQDVRIDGQVYTVMTHQSLEIKAPVGTTVYAASTGFGHRKGDLLLAVAPEMTGKAIFIN
jgi:hypothetical protein